MWKEVEAITGSTDFLDALYSRDEANWWRFPTPTIVAVQIAVTAVASENYDRRTLIFANTGASTIVLSTSGSMPAAGGIPLPIGSPVFALDYRTFGPLVCQAWFARAAAGPVNLFVLEASLEHWNLGDSGYASWSSADRDRWRDLYRSLVVFR